MMWFWLSVLWVVVACSLGAWLGIALRIAERNEEARHHVDEAVERELAQL